MSMPSTEGFEKTEEIELSQYVSLKERNMEECPLPATKRKLSSLI